MKEKKSDIAYQAMKNQILTNKWQPGEKHSILEIANKLKISRTPIAEAVKMLESDGLVKILPKGFVVSSYSKEETRELFEIKTVLEGFAAYKAALNTQDDKKSILFPIIEKQKHFFDINDLDNAANSDVEFHFAIFYLSHSSKLEKMTKALRHMGRCYSGVIFKKNELDMVYQEHIAIANAIVEGDAKKARQISEEHSDRYMKKILEKFEYLDAIECSDIVDDIKLSEILLSGSFSRN